MEKYVEVIEEISKNSSEEQLRVMVKHALRTLIDLGMFDDSHHKQYCIDQAVRCLSQQRYNELISMYELDEEGELQYFWDTGIAP